MAVRSQEMRNPVRAGSRQERPFVAVPTLSFHTFAYIITGLLALLAIYAIMGNVVSWGREQYDNFRYGTPRTFHAEMVVGHEDGAGTPSHFIALNLNRQVVIYQIPGGDSARTRVIQGPYLFGAGEDKTPVLLQFEDVNGDQLKDMIVNIKNEAIVYLNRDGQFQPLTPEERNQLVQNGQ
ncbi:MAG TPA: hypothetical protein VNL77_10080 [Roseiflexaceae bacterium]|nr:hypothetical protein [Roseiflexaceae bacterium]